MSQGQKLACQCLLILMIRDPSVCKGGQQGGSKRELWAGEIAQAVKVVAANHANLNCSLEPACWKKRADCHSLSFDSYT